MPTGLYVPGPAMIAVGPSAGTLAFLGYSVDGVNLTEEQEDVPAMTDYAGPRSPADLMLAGKNAFASMRITDYDPTVLATVLARYPGGVAGAVASNEIGTLLMTEGAAFRLCVKAHRQPLVTRYANYLPGFNMPTCFVRGQLNYPISTAPQVIPLTFFAWSSINKTTLAATVWDTNMTGFPTLT
jgi:hypothetical protein